MDDVYKYCKIRDTVGNRKWGLEQITSSQLHGWKDKETLNLFVRVYSISVESASLFKIMNKAFLDNAQYDRAGAATSEAQREKVRLEIRTLIRTCNRLFYCRETSRRPILGMTGCFGPTLLHLLIQALRRA